MWRESTSTDLGSWIDGTGSALISSSSRNVLLQGGTRTTLLVDHDRRPDQDGLSDLIREMKSVGSPTLDLIQGLADRDYEPNSVITVWRRTVEAATFDAAAPSWFGQFVLIGDEIVAARDLVPPIDEARKSTDEVGTAKRQAAYAAWRPLETARRIAESQAEVALWEVGRAHAIAEADRGPAAIRRAALIKVSIFAAWSLIVLVGAVSQSGVINQALTLVLFVGAPAYFLRHRFRTWIANCRFRPSPTDLDVLGGARPRPPGQPPEMAPPDWVEPTREVA